MPGAAVLAGRCEPYAAEVPAGAALIVAGVDLQHDRAEVELVGFGPWLRVVVARLSHALWRSDAAAIVGGA